MTPVLVCNVAWMKHYRGKQKDDKPLGGGSYPRETGKANEIYNFFPHQGRVLGFVQATKNTIRIERLGAKPDEDRVNGVTVAWAATDPEAGRTYVVGWYKNATVYRNQQAAPQDSKRYEPGTKKLYGSYVEASTADAHCLPVAERSLPVPRRGKGTMGRSMVWYPDSPHADGFLRDLRTLMQNGFDALVKKGSGRVSPGRSWQADVEKRTRVARLAVEAVGKWYEERGFAVSNVEDEKRGSDLVVAKPGSPPLQLEVKGLSGEEIGVELTPNEYRQMKTHRTYRLCIVTRADKLAEQRVDSFHFLKREARLQDQDGQILRLVEVVGARCYR